MTRQNLYIALGAGFVAAVVFASATTGPFVMRLLLFFFTPLPLFLAGLGWGWVTAALAGAFGAFLIGLIGGPAHGLMFAVTQGLPAAGLTYLALLNRATAGGPGEQPVVEWYPVGRLVLWTAAISGALALLTMLLLGGDLDALRKTLRELVEKFVKTELPQISGAPTLGDAEIQQLGDIAFHVLPGANAMTTMAGLLLNLWGAGRITLASGRLQRAWPDLAGISYPPGTPMLLAGAIAATFLEGYAGYAAAGFTGAFFLVYLLLGLAIFHFTTRGFVWRPMALTALYVGLFVMSPWVAIIVAFLGLIDSFIRLRNLPPGT